MGQAIEEMQLLVENHGNFSVDKLGEEHPELIARVKEICHRHHLIAHHYMKPNSHANHFSTPDKKHGMQNVKAHVSSDSSLRSGGGISDTTPVEGSRSSLMSSDSDSDSCNSSPIEHLSSLPSGKMLKHEIVNVGTGISEMGGEYKELMRLTDYEKELMVSKEKLLPAEEDIAKLKGNLLQNEALMIKMGSMEAQLVSAENQIKLQEADTEKESKKSLMLQKQIVVLEAKLESEKKQVEELQEIVQDRDFMTQKLYADLQDATGSFALEKWQLESSVSKLQKQCELLEAEKLEIVEKQEAQEISWQDNLELVKKELTEKNSAVDTLNKNLNELKRNYDKLKAEKDGVDAKLQTLNADISLRADKIQYFEGILLDLKSDNKHLCAEADCANKLATELKSRILELEKEVEMQAVVISDTADGKREAIKQLCFSLDHFRSAYHELREGCGIRKQPTAMVS